MAADHFTYSLINFDEPEPLTNKKVTIMAVVFSFMAFSWTCVLGRLWVRFKIIRDPGWDDFCVVMYLLTTTAGSIALVLGTKYGLGQHFLKLSHDDMVTWSKTFYIANAAYSTSTGFIKLALLLQYLRIYPKGSLMHRACVATLVLTALWGFTYSFMAWFPCFPVNHVWELIPDAKCYGYGSMRPSEFSGTYESHTATNMILDVIVLIIPLPLLFKDTTGTPQRLRICALLTMGTIVIGIAIWRLQTILEHKAATVPTRDPTWYGPITMLLAVLEVDAAAVCASVPIFWPVLSNRLSGIFVTQEVDVRRETRYFDQLTDEEAGFGALLKEAAAPGDGGVQPTQFGRSDSPTNEKPKHSRTGSKTEILTHSRTASKAEKPMHARTGSKTEILAHSRTNSKTEKLTHSRTNSKTEKLTHGRTASKSEHKRYLESDTTTTKPPQAYSQEPYSTDPLALPPLEILPPHEAVARAKLKSKKSALSLKWAS